MVVDDGTHDRELCRVGTPQPEKLVIEFQVLVGGIHKQLSRTLGRYLMEAKLLNRNRALYPCISVLNLT
jgi:hypothetical protein